MIFNRDEIIFLLGAGASVDAGIPASCDMIRKLESLLTKDRSWRKFTQLYNFVKSAIIYADGIKGNFDFSSFNIERLVNTLDELRRSDEHPLFPFIGSWNPKFSELTDNNFNDLNDFRKKIVEELTTKWMHSEYAENAHYYSKFSEFQKAYQHPLRIFSLNYDMCVEKNCHDVGVERGFGSGKHWDWKIFDNEDQIEKSIFLYKLHGSVDWIRENGQLTYKDSGIPPDETEIIFGTTYKLQYIDPFLFFAYELRKRLMTDAKLLVCIGYGFADEHINGIISQALNGPHARKMLIVMPCSSESEKRQHICSSLQIRTGDNVVLWRETAKDFFNNRFTVETLADVFPKEDAPFDDNVIEAKIAQ